MFSVFGLLSLRIKYKDVVRFAYCTRVLHTGRLPLKFAYCALYVYACGISFYIQNYCKPYQQSNHRSAYWMSSAYLHSFFIVALKKVCGQESMWNKWKNHLSEMKGDVGMSHRETEGEQCLYRDRKSLMTPSLPTPLIPCTHLQVFFYPKNNFIPIPTKQNSCISHKQRCRDGVINDFLSRYRHFLVPLLHDVTSLHPPSFQRNYFSTC